MSERQIVKVQASLFTTEKSQRVLIYNRARSYMREGPISPEITSLLSGRLKAYFYARIKGDELDLEEEAVEQPW